MTEFDVPAALLAVLREAATAVGNFRYYGPRHPYTLEHVGIAGRHLADLLENVPSLTLFIVADRLVVDDRPLPAGGLSVEKFTALLKDKGVERLTFHRGLGVQELADFLAQLAEKGGAPIRSTPCIRLGRVEFREAGESGAAAGPAGLGGLNLPVEGSLVLGETELDRIRELYHQAERGKPLDIRAVDGIVRRFIGVLLTDFDPVRLLASVKGAHEYTFTHAVNVGILTIVQAKSLGFGGQVLHEIGIASMLHDVGKIFVPEEILNKPGGLTPAERTVIETHTIKGGRFLLQQEGIPMIAALAAFEHHLKFDGSGYPFVYPDWKPSLVSQMIAIADVFDALRSRRSYSEPKTQEEIMKIFSEDRGVAFHPLLVDNFLALVKPGP
jgi:HD-GYP domain-containing protein (c-di-GMP phosphodiesterase class II)